MDMPVAFGADGLGSGFQRRAMTADSSPILDSRHDLGCPQDGRSADSLDTITYEKMTDDLAALIDHLKLGPVNVLGWSDGAIEAGFSASAIRTRSGRSSRWRRTSTRASKPSIQKRSACSNR
jgi:pimeloyl-ACP methyl ester carboxylesterase